MHTSAPGYTVACPTCAAPIPGLTGPGPACPRCGLPAAGHAGYVVARIEAALTEFRADRDRLLHSMRAVAGQIRPAAETDLAPAQRIDPGPTVSPSDQGPVQPSPERVPVVHRVFEPAPSWPERTDVPPPTPPTPPPAPSQRRRLSPQQLLLGTGVVLLLSAAIAFVAVAWGSLGLLVQASTLAALTASVCAASVVAARRGLRATGEALATAGLALVVIDLVAARVKGLAGLDQLPIRAHAALTLAVVVVIGLALHRLAATTIAWPIGALVAAQPLAFLALPEAARTAVPLVATCLLVSVLDVSLLRRVRGATAATALAFVGLWWGLGTVLGVLSAWTGSTLESVLCTLLVLAAGGIGVLVARDTRLERIALPAPILDLTVAAAGAAALAGTLQQTAMVGEWLTGVLGLAILTTTILLTAPALSARDRWHAPAGLAGSLLTGLSVAQLAAGWQWTELAGLAALATLGSVAVAVFDRAIRGPAAALATLLPGVAVLLLVADGLASQKGGWVLAVLAASALGLASARVHQVEERPLATSAAFVGLTAVTLTATTFSWGQLALQMSVVGAGLLAYGRAAADRPATLFGLADLVLAWWVGAAGMAVTTPEVYTLPAVAGLLLASGRRLRTAPSWAAWGAPLLVGLVPSTFVVLDQPSALRLVLLVAAATVCAALGTLTHRQAPFLIGLGVLLTLAVTELGPYATLLPRWLSLGLAGILLLALGATYERRLAQAREAITWVGALR